jgi:hypothetical protein
MHSLPGVRRDRHDLKQMTWFVKISRGENDFLSVVFLYNFFPLGGRSVFHTGSISNIEMAAQGCCAQTLDKQVVL